MNRDRMVKMLEAFDKELDKPLRIIITGASSLIIHRQHGIEKYFERKE